MDMGSFRLIRQRELLRNCEGGRLVFTRES